MRVTSTLAFSGLSAVASATNYLGFNSGSTLTDNSAKFKADWLAEFTTAQNLVGAPGTFNAVRLYTNIQAYSTSDPIQAFEAAIDTKTYILLGIWCSGTTSIANELTALKAAVAQYGTDFTDLVIGISIGSEDLYRVSATGVANDAGVGAGPDVIVGFINDFRTEFADTTLSSIPVGHVDTWDVWPNATNKAVIDAVDFIGVDEYPYYENGKNNVITNAGQLFDTAYDQAVAAAGGKPVWLTETGWPTTGPDWDLAVPSVENAKYYWNEVGCRRLFNQAPTFWYNLRDSNPANTMKFAVTSDLSTTPLFDLSCPTTFLTPNTTSSGTATTGVTTAVSTSSTGTATGTGTGSAGASVTSSTSTPSTSVKAGGATSMYMSSPVICAVMALIAGISLM